MMSLCWVNTGFDVLQSNDSRRWGTLIISFPSTLHLESETALLAKSLHTYKEVGSSCTWFTQLGFVFFF